LSIEPAASFAINGTIVMGWGRPTRYVHSAIEFRCAVGNLKDCRPDGEDDVTLRVAGCGAAGGVVERNSSQTGSSSLSREGGVRGISGEEQSPPVREHGVLCLNANPSKTTGRYGDVCDGFELDAIGRLQAGKMGAVEDDTRHWDAWVGK
jgi:hypothetical protein